MAQTKPRQAAQTVKKTTQTVAEHSRHVADSARELEHSSERIEDQATRTTRLAADRTILAAERTYASWVRTGLFAVASGVGARALLGLLPEWLIQLDASVLIAISMFCFGAAIWRHLNPRSATTGPRRAADSVSGADRSQCVPGAHLAGGADRHLGRAADLRPTLPARW
jgi:inner membrane protein YidH